MVKSYPSKRGFVVWIPLILLIGIEVLYVFTRQYIAGVLSIVIIGVAVLPIILHTRYTIATDNTLHIRCGLFLKMAIPIQCIKKVKPTKTILSAPALSFDRLEIFYNKFDSIVISPVDKESFIADLQCINPAIEYLS